MAIAVFFIARRGSSVKITEHSNNNKKVNKKMHTPTKKKKEPRGANKFLLCMYVTD